MNAAVWGAVILAGVVALSAPTFLRPSLRRMSVVDVPNQRSSHTTPTLRGGGVAPLLGLTFGGIWAFFPLPPSSSLAFASVCGAAALVSLVGLTEDLRGLPISVRAGTQILIGGAMTISFSWGLGVSWIWVFIAAVSFAAHVNFTNFMDGVNGISSVHGLVVGLAFAALGGIEAEPWLTTIGSITALIFVTFLPWNLIPPGIFLGDAGSYLLGGVLGATAIASILKGLNPVAALAPLSIYWADAVSTLLRRAKRREPVFEAHRTHVYQRLTNIGCTHVGVAVIVGVFTAANSSIGLLLADLNLRWPMGLAGISALTAIYLLLPRFFGDRLSPKPVNYFHPVPLPPDTPARSDWNPRVWAVIGASGFVGSGVVDELTSQGFRVRTLVAPRLTLRYRGTDGRLLTTLAGKLPELIALAEALEGVDVVVNAAGAASPDGIDSDALFGANALLPTLISLAAFRARVGRVIHTSSAAVQGRRSVLDASTKVEPFSPYSQSKALGERGILTLMTGGTGTGLVIVRATSVQGSGRNTTTSLIRVASSQFASVAAPGDQPTVVSSLTGLARCIRKVGTDHKSLPPVVLQPWEGMNVQEVLEVAGGRPPVVLPRWICIFVVATLRGVGQVLPRMAGVARRVELMWFGQRQAGSSESSRELSADLRRVLSDHRSKSETTPGAPPTPDSHVGKCRGDEG